MWPTSTSSVAAPTGPLRREARDRARPHTRQTRCTPFARRAEIDWAPLIASTSAEPKGRRPPGGPPSRRAARSP